MKEDFLRFILELEELKNDFVNEYDEKIKQFKKAIFESDKFIELSNINLDKNNLKLFEDYLKNSLKLKNSSISSYVSSLETIKMMLEIKYEVKIPFEIYEVNDANWIESLIIKFESNSDLVEKNLLWHHILSASYNNYLKFLKHKIDIASPVNMMKKINLSKNTFIFYDSHLSRIGRKPTHSNFKRHGSDNSMYFGSTDNLEILNMICSVFKLSNINDFDKKIYKMSMSVYNYEVLTNINADGQIQIKVCGDGSIADLFIKYQMVNDVNLEQEQAVLIFDFNNNTIDFVGEGEVNDTSS